MADRPWLVGAVLLLVLSVVSARDAGRSLGQATAVGGAARSAVSHASRIHRDAIVLDTHIDTTAKLGRRGWDFMARHRPGRGGDSSHVDHPRMRDGGLDAAFFSIYVPGTVTGSQAIARARAQIEHVRQLAAAHPAELTLALTAADVRAAHQAGTIAVLMGMEGGHMIGDSLAVLRNYQARGVRYLTLTHSVNTSWGDAAGRRATHNGLTSFGKAVVGELNRLGMMVDVSHVADKTFWDALAVSRSPLVASHSSVRALSGHARNMSDEMIRALAAKGGVIQINFLDEYLDDEVYRAVAARRAELSAFDAVLQQRHPGAANASRRRQELRAVQAALPSLPTASWQRIVDHIDHVVRLVGARHVGLGSDFDGARMPEGMEDCSHLPRITEALIERGYSEQDVRNILGENLLRVMESAEIVARKLAKSV